MKKNLQIIGIVTLFLVLVIFLLCNNELHNDTLERTEPMNLSSVDYIKLEPEKLVRQTIKITGNAIYLNDIEVILINLSDETNNDILNVEILQNGTSIKKAMLSVEQAVAGEWSSIPIGKTISPKYEYTIEFSLQNNDGTDIPYLVTQNIEEASPYHVQLFINNEKSEQSVAITYNFYGVIPFAIKLVISILCLLVTIGIIYLILKKKVISENNQSIKRDANCDLMRVICMIFVIAIHSERSFINSPFWDVIVTTLLFTCNGIFYMLSGRFNLQKKFVSKENYKKFYINKAITIFFPYLLITCIQSLWDIQVNSGWNGIVPFFQETYSSFMNTNSGIHFWFMYPLVGMLLGTPFIAKMLQNMSNWELNILFGIGMGWNIVSIYLTSDFGIGFSYSGWLLSGWSMLYFLGYYCSRIINQSNKKYFYILGIIGFLITALCRYLIPDKYNNSTDIAVAFILFTMAFYTFWNNEISIKSEFIKKIIHFITKYSFLIYLLHWNVLFKITPKIVNIQPTFTNWIMRIFTTMIISLLFSVILDFLIISPIQRIVRKNFL